MNIEHLAELNTDEFYAHASDSLEFTELPEESFIQFVRHIHGLESITYDNVWQMVVIQELNRSFSEGYAYCRSHLEVVPGPNCGFRRWWYITTSGTVLQAIKPNSSDKTACGVGLPFSRLEGYTARILKLYGENPNLRFFSDWEMLSSTPGTPEHFAAKVRGITPTAEKTWEQMSTHEKRDVGPLFSCAVPDVEEDFEEYGYDEYEYDDEE